MRPERPRDRWAGQSLVQKFSRPFRPQGGVALFPQGIGLRPQPWARVSRPVGPVDRSKDEIAFPGACRELTRHFWSDEVLAGLVISLPRLKVSRIGPVGKEGDDFPPTLTGAKALLGWAVY